MEDELQRKSRAPALLRALTILNILERRPSTIGDIIKESGLPRSTVYVLMDEMSRLSLIKQNRQGLYQLWFKVIRLGRAASEGLDLRDIMNPHLDALLNSTDCIAVHYGVMDGGRAFYVIKKESPKAGFHILSREGMEISLVHAGLGKCLLAFQDIQVQERILSSIDYSPKTPTSITTQDDLRRELAQIRLQGWAFDNSEGESEIRCVAVPIYDRDRNVLGAISIVGARSRFTDEEIPAVVERVKSCAQAISSELI